MTSYSVGNKTSLSGKPCIADKKYYGSLTGSHGCSFRIYNEKWRERPYVGEITMTSVPVDNKISASRKPCIADKKCYGSLSGKHGRSFRTRREKVRAALPGGGLTMTSCPVGNKISLSRKPCIVTFQLPWITIMKSWSLCNFKKNSKQLF